MNTEQERADFEAWVSENGAFPHAVEKFEDGGYAYLQTQTFWVAWEARAALQSQDREDVLIDAETKRRLP